MLEHKIPRLGASRAAEEAPTTCTDTPRAPRAPRSQFNCQMGFSFKRGKKKKKKKKEEGFSVSNPVAASLPIGSVNHFLLADPHHFSFRNGTFLLCGFAVYTHFATLCQHLLMNKYVAGLLRARPCWRQTGQFSPANGLIPALTLQPIKGRAVCRARLIPWMGRNKGYQGTSPDITHF